MPGPSKRTPKRLRIVPDEPNNDPGPVPKSPKTPSMKKDSLSFLFGDPIPNFGNNPITSAQVICNWMYEYDQKRGLSWKMSGDDKVLVIKKVVSNLIGHWKTQDVKPAILYYQVQRLVEKAEKLQRFKRPIMEKNDLEKLEQLRRPFLVEFMPYTPKKETPKKHDNKDDDLELVRFTFFITGFDYFFFQLNFYLPHLRYCNWLNDPLIHSCRDFFYHFFFHMHQVVNIANDQKVLCVFCCHLK